MLKISIRLLTRSGQILFCEGNTYISYNKYLYNIKIIFKLRDIYLLL